MNVNYGDNTTNREIKFLCDIKSVLKVLDQVCTHVKINSIFKEQWVMHIIYENR